MQTEAAIETQATMKIWLVDRSRIAAETGAVWTFADHEALVEHLQKIDQLVTQLIAEARSSVE